MIYTIIDSLVCNLCYGCATSKSSFVAAFDFTPSKIRSCAKSFNIIHFKNGTKAFRKVKTS